MYYITYSNEECNDGAGAQIQRILSLKLLSSIYDVGYIHSKILYNSKTSFYSIKDVISENELHSFNNLFEQLNLNKSDVVYDEVIIMSHFDLNIITSKSNVGNILFKIGYCHDYLDSHSELMNSYLPVNLDWVVNKVNKKLIIAIHIRRGDVSETQHAERFVSTEIYIDCINKLTSILSDFFFEYRIFSDSLTTLDCNKIKDGCSSSNIFFFINKNIVDTFKEFVNSDIFIASKSSFSYSASFLRQKGIILYFPIIHVYSNKNVCIETSHDIVINKQKIIESLQKDIKD